VARLITVISFTETPVARAQSVGERLQRKRALGALIAASFLLAFSAVRAEGPDAGDWPMAAKDYASTRYSGLAQIDRANVSSLTVAFTFSTGVQKVVGATSDIVRGNLVAPSPFFALPSTYSVPG